jgi:hypothetical protein
MSGPYRDVKREVEAILANILNESLQITFVPFKGDDEDREFPFGVVKCGTAKPLVGGSEPRGYMCNVKVVYVTHIDDVESIEHSKAVALIEDVLASIPKREVADYKLEENHVRVAGMFIEELTDSSEDQSHGDMFSIRVGVTGIC